MNDNQKLFEKLKKLYELSKRGVGGESVNAEVMLEKLLKKYGLTIESLLDSEKRQYIFKVKSLIERQILFSVTTKTLQTRNMSYGSNKKSTTIYLDLTPSDYAEIKIQFDAYIRAFKKYIEQSQSAFIHANYLFYYKDGTETPKEEKPLTAEEKEDIWVISQMMMSAPKPNIPRGYIEHEPKAP